MRRILAALLWLAALPAWAATTTPENGVGDTDSTPNTSGAFTPVANDLLVIVVSISDTTQNPATCTSSIGGFTFTQVARALFNSGVQSLFVFVSNALVSDTASQTVTCDTASDAGTGTNIHVYAVAGMSRTGSAAVKQVKENSDVAGSTTPEIVFTSAVATGNPTIVATAQQSTAAQTAPTNWTEGFDTNHASPNNALETAYRDSGFTGTTVTWGTTSNAHGDIGVELDTSAACSGTPTITDVDTDESVTATQLNVVIAGTGFGAAQETGTVTLRQSGNSKTLSVDSWSDTSIQVDMSGVGMGVADGLLYGAMDIRVTNCATNFDDQAITATAPSGTINATLSGGLVPLAFDEHGNPNRAFGDLIDVLAASQIALRNAAGCTLSTDVTINPDGSLDVNEACTAFDYDFTTNDGSGGSHLYLGTVNTLSWAGDPPLMGETDIENHILAVGLAMTAYDLDTYFVPGAEALSSYALRQQSTPADSTTDVNGAVSGADVLVVDDASVLLDNLDDWIRCATGTPVQIKYVNPITNQVGLHDTVTCADNAQVDIYADGAGSVSGVTLGAGTGAVSGTPNTDATTSLLVYRVTDADGLTADVRIPFEIDVVTIPDVTADDLATGTSTLEALGLTVNPTRVCSTAEAPDEILTQDEESVLWGTNGLLTYASLCNGLRTKLGLGLSIP